MTEELTLKTERVDDLPLLLAQLQRMELPALLDRHFPVHGHWEGLSFGWLTTVWLAHLLSQGDHRLNQVRPWAADRLQTLQRCTGQEVRTLDLTDDRLAQVLHGFSHDAHWQACEQALNAGLLRVYELPTMVVRLDSTTASHYGSVSPAGLFQFGHSKDRPDLPQLKVALATLDPLALPLVTEVVSGERADDPLYLPLIARVRRSLGRSGLLYVGDCKMAALATRAKVAAQGDYYLCPLAEKQLPREELARLLAPVWTGEQPLTPVERDPEVAGADATPTKIAEGFEREQILTTVVDGQRVTWTERQLVVRSCRAAAAGEAALQARLTQAVAAVTALTQWRRGKKRYREVADLEPVVAQLLRQHRVEGLVQVSYPTSPHPLGEAARGRRVGAPSLQVRVAIDPEAVAEAVRRLGWRVYATNAPGACWPLGQVVRAYREQYRVEHCFGRLKGRPLSLTPMYLDRDDHATGLVRLLTIALRVLTVVEFQVRQQLQAAGEALAGLYAGQPKRATARPTSEALLRAFQGITLTVMSGGPVRLRHLTPLTGLQERILALLRLSPDIYLQLCSDHPNPP